MAWRILCQLCVRSMFRLHCSPHGSLDMQPDLLPLVVAVELVGQKLKESGSVGHDGGHVRSVRAQYLAGDPAKEAFRPVPAMARW